jgi:hypothetical protein
MSLKRLPGRGRLVSTRPTGIAYRVRHGVHVVENIPPPGKRLVAAQWAKCSVRLENVGRIPDGNYFLYTDEGKVHQLRSVNGKWHYLTVAA